jgi:hypothetical protein
LQEAVHEYELLLHDYPADARVGLAAFELGRLKMDDFRDIRGAVTALELAIRVVGDAGLREDAMARLVRAFEALNDEAACQEARATYLETYPTGTHVLAVARACTLK